MSADKYLELDDMLNAKRRHKQLFVAALDAEIRSIEKEMEAIKEKILREYEEHGVVPMSDTLHVKRTPCTWVVTDESLIPEQFFKIEKKLEKGKLNKALDGGLRLDGVTRSNGGLTLEIRVRK